MKPISKNTNDFVQVTRGYMKDMRELSKRSNVAFQILWLLTERMNRTNAIVMSQTTMAKILGVGRTSVHNGLAILKNEQWVQIIKIGTANGYVINSKVAWRASNKSGKRYATFNADVIVSEDEQQQQIEDWDNVELRQIPVLQKNELPIDGNEELPPPNQGEILDADFDNEIPLIKENG